MEFQCFILIIIFITCGELRFASATVQCSVCGCDDVAKTELPLLINCQKVDTKILLRDLDFVKNLSAFPGILLEIDLSYNKLETLDYFPKSPILRASFQFNQINSLEPGVLSNMTQLSMLDLSYNQITKDSLIGGMFRSAANSSKNLQISSLDLSYNQIAALDLSTFWNLPFLDHLSLSGNPLKFIDPMTMGALGMAKKITSLRLSSTGLSELPNKFLEDSRIQTLDISFNNFTQLPQIWGNMASLNDLTIDGNPIIVLNQSSVQGLSSLKILRASNMPHLEIIEPGSFQNMTSLSSLILSYNKKLTKIVKVFGDMDIQTFQLKTLVLKNDSLEKISRDDFPDWFWNKIEIVDLRDNPWYCDCRMKWFLENALPRLSEKSKSADFTNDVLCENPSGAKGKMLVDIFPEKMICHFGKALVEIDPSTENKPSTGYAVGLAFLGIACILILTFLFVVRHGIKRKWAQAFKNRGRRFSLNLENTVYRNNPTSSPLDSDDDF